MNLSAWRYYSRFYQGSRPRLLLTVLSSLGLSGLSLLIILLIRYAFDRAIPAGHFSTLFLIGGAIVLLYLLTGSVTLWIRYVILEITKTVIQRFRDEILKKFYTIPHLMAVEMDRSALHTIAVQDTERLDIMSNALMGQVIPALFTASAISAILLYLNWFLFLLLLAIVPFLVGISKVLGKMARKRVRDFHASFEAFSRGVLFLLRVMDLTRIQAAEDFEISRQRKNIDELRLTSKEMSWLNAAHTLSQNTVVACSGVIILIGGGIAVARGSMTLGDFLSFFAAVSLLRTHLSLIAFSLPQIIEGNASLETIYNWLEIRKSTPYSGTRKISFGGKITLEGVCFEFDDRPILRDINLTLFPGRMTAIIGPNGAGKTTIVNLILGLYRPRKGRLFADDYPFDELDIISLRRSIGVIRQDPIIFPGTILENITYGSPETDFSRVIQAARTATAHEFIDRLERGYQTRVGEYGLMLSGGERQRIAIARALLHQPRLLILDEPTNHLDRDSIYKLMDNLKMGENPPASLLISHDPAVAEAAHLVYHLDQGRISSRED